MSEENSAGHFDCLWSVLFVGIGLSNCFRDECSAEATPQLGMRAAMPVKVPQRHMARQSRLRFVVRIVDFTQRRSEDPQFGGTSSLRQTGGDAPRCAPGGSDQRWTYGPTAASTCSSRPDSLPCALRKRLRVRRAHCERARVPDEQTQSTRAAALPQGDSHSGYDHHREP